MNISCRSHFPSATSPENITEKFATYRYVYVFVMYELLFSADGTKVKCKLLNSNLLLRGLLIPLEVLEGLTNFLQFTAFSTPYRPPQPTVLVLVLSTGVTTNK